MYVSKIPRNASNRWLPSLSDVQKEHNSELALVFGFREGPNRWMDGQLEPKRKVTRGMGLLRTTKNSSNSELEALRIPGLDSNSRLLAFWRFLFEGRPRSVEILAVE